MKIHHVALLLSLLGVGIFPAISQERPGCFRRNSSGEYEQLDHLCPRPIPPSPATTPPPPPPEIGFEPQLIEGLQLSGLRLENEGDQRFLVGYITNKTRSPIRVDAVDIQFIDVDSNIVITAETFDMNNTRLSSGQTREFRQLLNDLFALGGRKNDEMKTQFTGWR